MARSILPLPSGLIGKAGPVTFDYAAAKPFFPFLSLAQLMLLLPIYLVTIPLVVGAFLLAMPAATRHFLLPFVAVGSVLGTLPNILMAAPSRIQVHTPRPEPWADFTRSWAAASRYRQQESNPNVWLPNMHILNRWPGDAIRLHVTSDGLEVTGRRLMMRYLKRNFDRITDRGFRGI